MKKLILMLILAGSLSCCGGGQDNAGISDSSLAHLRVLGGEAANNQNLSVVKLRIYNPDGTVGLCSAAAVSYNTFLTAAHCVKKSHVIEVEASGKRYPIAEVYTATGFRYDYINNAIFNDLAVLKTTENLTVKPLAIAAGNAVTTDLAGVVYGYGVNSSGSYGELKSGIVQLAYVTANHLFSKPFYGRGSNACAGDSGGPLVAAFQYPDGRQLSGIVGLVSSGTTRDCRSGDVTLYTNLQNPALVSFILEHAPDTVIY
ncbi:MAG: S1 family peptidase [Candidatus Dadabacteria bacterium]|nr:MAG: S1 family peptidase [Candidatus Dadabacteria bacterium]